jgi:hypothetical protein
VVRVVVRVQVEGRVEGGTDLCTFGNAMFDCPEQK